jgi:hypothetical protein
MSSHNLRPRQRRPARAAKDVSKARAAAQSLGAPQAEISNPMYQSETSPLPLSHHQTRLITPDQRAEYQLLTTQGTEGGGPDTSHTSVQDQPGRPAPPVGWFERRMLWSSRQPKTTVPPLPRIAPLIVLSVESSPYVGHALSYVVFASIRNEQPRKMFLKVYTDQFKDEFKAEANAYFQFLLRGICGKYVPLVYGRHTSSYQIWNEQFPDIPVLRTDEITRNVHVLAIQFLDGFLPVSRENITFGMIGSALEGIVAIHSSDVIHQDVVPRNLLVRPHDNRAIWVDFSCSWCRPTFSEQAGEIHTVSILLLETLV